MSIFRKLKSLFGAAEEPAPAEPLQEEEPVEQEPAADEKALEEARRREEALLEALSALHIAQSDTQTSSFLLMHSYRFEAPFDSRTMLHLVNGMRWIGFRLYSFSVRVDGQEIDCESWQSFLRHLGESAVEAVNLLTSFGGVRVNAVVEAGGAVHFSHDSSRGVDLSPFESLFDPEEMPEEAE
ncbi:MAG: hypothetical protein IJC54_06055 [Clostridia bacterium]|nr:hypothetical protein [Clostridia bacterium]